MLFRSEVVIDDARHYIATTRETFDIITSDPIHPWVKGSAVLYSQEYLDLCRRRLNPGGLLTQWIPLYESDHAVVRTEIATFLAAFPQGTIWSNDDEGYGYDTVALGQPSPQVLFGGFAVGTIEEHKALFHVTDRVHGGARVKGPLTKLSLNTAELFVSGGPN